MAKVSPRRRTRNELCTAVKFTDPDSGESISFTISDSSLSTVAKDAHTYLRGRYRATDINDNRHKRRL